VGGVLFEERRIYDSLGWAAMVGGGGAIITPGNGRMKTGSYLVT
jgi:hypothetical protein